MLRILTLFFGVLVLSSAFAEGVKPSHCSPDEKIYFSCSTGKKLVSYCGSKQISATNGYLQYRFGAKEKIEISVPAVKELASRAFTFDFSQNARATSSDYELSVKNGRMVYELEGQAVYELEYSDPENSASLKVFPEGNPEKPLATLVCKTIYENRLDDLKPGLLRDR